ncbi:MAG: dockerin type I repeat-containing protein [Clostridia bacterium]|nr:dockerin type I repeat-containing protein [Clostridia bacterium]
MKKALSIILSVAMLMTVALSMFVVPASAEDPVHTYEMMNPAWIAEGAENVTVNEDGTWTVTGNIGIAPDPAPTLDYTVYYNIIQKWTSVGGGVKVTVLDRDPNGVYEDHWINLYGQWVGGEFFPEGETNQTNSIKSVFDWCTANLGWGNTNNQFTVRAVYIEPEAGATVTLESIAFNDGIYDYQLGTETPTFEYDNQTLIAPKDADIWEQIPVSGSLVNITYDTEKLVLGNTNGAWPSVFLDFATPYVVNEESMIYADFSIEKGAKTTIYLFFGQATCNEFDNGAYGVVHYELGAEVAAGNYKGYVNIVDMLPTDEAARAACYNADGDLTITGIKIFATSEAEGAMDPAVTIRNLDLLTQAEANEDVLMGDMNGDGDLNTMDALLLFGGINGARELTEAQQAVADYTGDGNVNMMDALLLFKAVSGG